MLLKTLYQLHNKPTKNISGHSDLSFNFGIDFLCDLALDLASDSVYSPFVSILL